MFGGFYAGRRVLVTGHTGFKGSWLTRWLLDLGAEVTGLALAPDTTPSLFRLLELEGAIGHHEVDVRDGAGVARVVAAARPEVILHLAAQPLVRLSYRETDAMGGHDPYSSSKGAVELAVASWRRSFFADPAGPRLASARAGNVIGGGDWAADRIVVDFVRAITAGQPLVLRNPRATRPWQHVLEPLSGYLQLAARLCAEDGATCADGWNFGPAEASIVPVEQLARGLVAAWGQGEVRVTGEPAPLHEAGLLRLDCAKARALLGWHGAWDFAETLRYTVDWYRGQHLGGSAQALTHDQIQAYQAAATQAGLPWTS